MNLKRIAVVIIALILGIVLGALLAGTANIALGQVDAEQFIIALPPSPCNVAVQSRILSAEDGTATATLIAYPPSPCTMLDFNMVSVPEDAAHCTEVGRAARTKVLNCEFSTDHISTTFYFNAIARE